MDYYKARVDYSKDPDGALSGPSHNIQEKLVLNAASFPALPITMAAFLALITTWDTALGESLKGGSDRTTLKNNARTALENALFKLGTYVNLVADGDTVEMPVHHGSPCSQGRKHFPTTGERYWQANCRPGRKSPTKCVWNR